MSFVEQVKITGNLGVALDAVLAATKPANVLQVGGNDGTNAYAIPLTSGGAAVSISGAVTNLGTFAVQATQSGNWTSRIVGASGVTLDAVLGATKPANVLQVGGNDGTNAYGIPLASGGGSVVISGTATANQGTAGTSTAPWYTRYGAPTTALWSQAAINFSASGATVIVAGVSSQTIRVMRIFFVNSNTTTATNITIQDSTPASFSGAFLLQAGGQFNGAPSGEPLWVTASGKGFQLNSSGAVQISGVVWYTQS